VGAGKMAGLAARALKGQGADILVTNRTPGRAEELAARIGGRVHPFEDLAGALERADIVIASTGARQPVLTRELVGRIQRRRRGRLLFLIDIAVPRDVEPACAEVADVFVADLDDLQRLADQHRDGRRAEADRAEALVEQEVSRFLEAYRGRRVAPVITALRQRFFGVAGQETERALAGLSGLGDKERAAIQQLVEGVVKKLLHEPQVALKRGGADPIEGAALVAAAQRLFNLEVPEPGALEPPAEKGSDGSSEDQGQETSPGQSPRKIAGR
jgi:glutamyl-tRNA reductase